MFAHTLTTDLDTKYNSPCSFFFAWKQKEKKGEKYIKEPANTADNATASYVNGKRITDVPGPRPVTGL